MFTKINRSAIAIIVALFIMFVAIAVFNKPTEVSAAPQADITANSCLTCHEDLYYLHDTGKSYCITNHTDRCINCHEGNNATMKKEESHLGLILHPQANSGEKCLECHTAQETQIRLSKFESEAGFDKVITADVYVPSVEVATGFPDTPQANPFIENWKWLTGFSVLFGFWLMLVLFSPMKP